MKSPRPAPRCKARHGFTLIEVMIAFVVLVIVTYILYTLLIQGSQSAVAGIWRKTTGGRLQQASERIRKVLDSASYPSVLAPEQNLIDESENHYIVLNGAGPEASRDIEVLEGQDAEGAAGEGGTYRCLGPGRKGGSDGYGDEDKVLVFFAKSCTAGRERMEGMNPPDQDGKCALTWVWLQNKRKVQHGGLFEGVMDLYFATRNETYPGQLPAGGSSGAATITVAGGPGEIPNQGDLLCPDVNSVRVRVLDRDGKGVVGKIPDKKRSATDPDNMQDPTVEIAIRCVDTDRGTATLGKIVAVRPHVGVSLE